jgi:CBS domain-containing protein
VGLLRQGLALPRLFYGIMKVYGIMKAGALPACLPNCLPNCPAAVARNEPLRPALDSCVWSLKIRRTFIMTTVRHILDQKGNQVWSLHSGDTAYDATKMMADKDVGALVVLDGSKIVGIVTERDYARNVF